MHDLNDGEFADNQGFLGKDPSRVNASRKVIPVKMPEFVQVIRERPQLMRIVKKYIKDIDRDCNGYVTNQELDDIFKLVFPSQLGEKDLLRLLRPFASIQNTILIEYKKLYTFLESALGSNAQETPKLNKSFDLTSPRHKKVIDMSASLTYIPKPHVMLSPDTFQPLTIPNSTRNLKLHSRTQSTKQH